jgi:lysophospholipase L1-like esterase
MGRVGRIALFISAVILSAGCRPTVSKMVPDRAKGEHIIDLRDPMHGSLRVEGTVHFGDLKAPIVLSWQPEDVFVEVPEGLSGEIPVYVQILGVKSNTTKLSILLNEPLLRILFFGDSIVYQGVPESLQTLLDHDPYLSGLEPVVMNHGKSMELLSREATRTRWSNALDFHEPNLAILLEATNDVSDNEHTLLESVQNSAIEVIDEAMFKGVDLILCTLLPRVAPCGDVESPTTEEYNAWLKSYAHGRGIPLVDIYQGFVSTPGWETLYFNDTDCAHPNAEGNKKIAETIIEEIEGLYLTSCTDLDGDGYGDPTAASCESFGRDCDDGDPDVYPAAIEVECGNGVDDDCDGLADGLDEDCMSGSCADPAEASVHATKRVYGASELLRHLAGFLLPVGLAVAWRSRRRKR